MARGVSLVDEGWIANRKKARDGYTSGYLLSPYFWTFRLQVPFVATLTPLLAVESSFGQQAHGRQPYQTVDLGQQWTEMLWCDKGREIRGVSRRVASSRKLITAYRGALQPRPFGCSDRSPQ